MIPFAIVMFVITAAGGVALASHLLKGRLAPWPVSVLHALFGAVGLLMVTVAVVTSEGGPRLFYALMFLVAAAAGGLVLVSFHLRKSVAPRAVVLVHAGVAVIGVLMLVSLLPIQAA